jgi:hypothetical protein
MEPRVTSPAYEPQRGEIRRIARMAALARVVPIGNIGGGPGLRCLAVLLLLHGLGAPLFRLLIRIEPKLAALHRRLARRGQAAS